MNLKLYSSLDRVRVSGKNLSIEASGKHVRAFIITVGFMLLALVLVPLFMANNNN